MQKTTIQSGKHSAKSGVLKLQHGLYCLKVNFFFEVFLFFSLAKTFNHGMRKFQNSFT